MWENVTFNSSQIFRLAKIQWSVKDFILKNKQKNPNNLLKINIVQCGCFSLRFAFL